MDKFRFFNTGRFPIEIGIWPENLFAKISKILRSLNSPIQSGISLVNKFSRKLREVHELSLCIDSGILPVRRFSLKWVKSTNFRRKQPPISPGSCSGNQFVLKFMPFKSYKASIPIGTTPSSKLSNESRAWRPLKNHILEGNFPKSLLDEKKRQTYLIKNFRKLFF
jgi:hypothetical protein